MNNTTNTAPAADLVKLAIKNNNLSTWERCPLCGTDIHSDIGPYLTLVDGWDPVCDECAAKADTVLFDVIHAWHKHGRLTAYDEEREAVEPAPPLPDATADTLHPLDPAAIVFAINSLVWEMDQVLAMAGDPAALDTLLQLSDRLADVSDTLAYAVTANDIVRQSQGRLVRRAAALVEVYNLPEDHLDGMGAYIEQQPLCVFGERFGTPPEPYSQGTPFDDYHPADEDVPF